MRNFFGPHTDATRSRNVRGGVISNGERKPRWDDKIEKLTIGSLDDVTLTVQAQYNPKELQIDKQIPWLEHSRMPAREQRHDSEQDEVEINSAPTRSTSIELLFDGYEAYRSIQPDVAKLETLSSIRKADSPEAHLCRPHHCIVTWGTEGVTPFRCVIESLSTKFTMFAPNGAPLRAICTVKLKEVQVMSKPAGQNHVGSEVLRPLHTRQR